MSRVRIPPPRPFEIKGFRRKAETFFSALYLLAWSVTYWIVVFSFAASGLDRNWKGAIYFGSGLGAEDFGGLLVHWIQSRLRMKSNWKFPCFLLVACLTSLPSFAVAPTTEANASAKTATKLDTKSQRKVQPKAQSTAKPKSATKAKPREPKAVSRAATPKLPADAAKTASPERSGLSLDPPGSKETDLDADTAAARQAVMDNPGDTAARERLARITVTVTDNLLRAEAAGEYREGWRTHAEIDYGPA
jgi:hypothetical protein